MEDIGERSVSVSVIVEAPIEKSFSVLINEKDLTQTPLQFIDKVEKASDEQVEEVRLVEHGCTDLPPVNRLLTKLRLNESDPREVSLDEEEEKVAGVVAEENFDSEMVERIVS